MNKEYIIENNDNIVLKQQLISTSQEYVKLFRKIQKLELEMNREIDNIKDRYHSKIKLIKVNLKDLEENLKDITEKNKEKFFTENKRKLDCNVLVLGYRKSSEITIPTAQKDQIVSYLENNELEEYLDIKKTIRKNLLSNWSDGDLLEIGIKRIYKDRFYLEIKNEVF